MQLRNSPRREFDLATRESLHRSPRAFRSSVTGTSALSDVTSISRPVASRAWTNGSSQVNSCTSVRRARPHSVGTWTPRIQDDSKIERIDRSIVVHIGIEFPLAIAVPSLEHCGDVESINAGVVGQRTRGFANHAVGFRRRWCAGRPDQQLSSAAGHRWALCRGTELRRNRIRWLQSMGAVGVPKSCRIRAVPHLEPS